MVMAGHQCRGKADLYLRPFPARRARRGFVLLFHIWSTISRTSWKTPSAPPQSKGGNSLPDLRGTPVELLRLGRLDGKAGHCVVPRAAIMPAK